LNNWGRSSLDSGLPPHPVTGYYNNVKKTKMFPNLSEVGKRPCFRFCQSNYGKICDDFLIKLPISVYYTFFGATHGVRLRFSRSKEFGWISAN